MKKQKRINLNSRDGINNWLEHYNWNTYILKSECSTFNVGYMDSDKELIAYIDPPGGPFISIGKIMDEVGKEVLEINHIKGEGFAITFKE